MRIAIPMVNGRLCMHFGHCEQFAFVDVDAEGKTILQTEFIAPPPHVPGLLPEWIHGQGATVVLAGGMGARAQSLLAEGGIKTITGVPDEDPESIVKAYLAGTMVSGENTCDH